MEIIEIRIKNEISNPYVLTKALQAEGMQVPYIKPEVIGFCGLTAEQTIQVINFLSIWENPKTDDEAIKEEQDTIKAEIEAVEEEKFLARLEKFVDKSALKAKEEKEK